MIIRRSIDEDLPVIEDIAGNCIASMRARNLDFWDENYPNRTIFQDDITGGFLFSIIRDGRIIGSLGITDVLVPEYSDVPWEHNRFLIIRRLMIDPAHQRHGHAEQAMILAEAEIFRRGVASVRLAVYAENKAANHLYKKLGYHVRGTVMLAKGPSLLYEKKLVE